MKTKKKITLQQFLPLSEAEIQGLLHQTQANPATFSCVVSVSPAALNTV
jgi:hypothetical protein